MPGLIAVLPEGVLAAAATTGALSAQTAGHAAEVLGVGAVVPPGAEEISAANAARITAHAGQVSGVLAAAGVIKGLYGVSAGLSAATYLIGDAINDVALVGSVAGLI